MLGQRGVDQIMYCSVTAARKTTTLQYETLVYCMRVTLSVCSIVLLLLVLRLMHVR